MKRLLTLILLAVASTVAVGCSDSTGPFHPTPSALTATWNRLDEVPGSNEQWNLTVSDTVVTGAGRWTAEVCCSGTLTITGYTSRDSLHVDVTMTTTGGTRDPRLEHFDGVLQERTLLVGNVTYTVSQGTFSGGVAQFRKTN